MAIYFNDRILSPKEDGNELERLLFTGMQTIDQLLKDNNGSITLIRTVERKKSTDGTTFKPVPPFSFPSTVSVYTKDYGVVELRYSATSPQKQGDNVIWNNVDIMVYESMSFNENNLDLAWYLIIATPFVKKGQMKIHDELENVRLRAVKFNLISKFNGLLVNAEEEMLDAIGKIMNIALHERATKADKVLLIGESINALDADGITSAINVAENTIQKYENKKPEVFKPEPSGKEYTLDELNGYSLAELNQIAGPMGIIKCPPGKKAHTINGILKKQEEGVL